MTTSARSSSFPIRVCCMIFWVSFVFFFFGRVRWLCERHQLMRAMLSSLSGLDYLQQKHCEGHGPTLCECAVCAVRSTRHAGGGCSACTRSLACMAGSRINIRPRGRGALPTIGRLQNHCCMRDKMQKADRRAINAANGKVCECLRSTH